VAERISALFKQTFAPTDKHVLLFQPLAAILSSCSASDDSMAVHRSIARSTKTAACNKNCFVIIDISSSNHLANTMDSSGTETVHENTTFRLNARTYQYSSTNMRNEIGTTCWSLSSCARIFMFVKSSNMRTRSAMALDAIRAS
jgi:hypothetical protein